MKYLRHNPLKARDGEPLEQVQAALTRWNREIAGMRVHGTTGRRPADVFEQEERPALRPLPPRVYELTVWKKARVHPDSHVAFRDRLFSVPWGLIHEEVWIRATPSRLEVLHDHAAWQSTSARAAGARPSRPTCPTTAGSYATGVGRCGRSELRASVLRRSSLCARSLAATRY